MRTVGYCIKIKLYQNQSIAVGITGKQPNCNSGCFCLINIAIGRRMLVPPVKVKGIKQIDHFGSPTDLQRYLSNGEKISYHACNRFALTPTVS